MTAKIGHSKYSPDFEKLAGTKGWASLHPAIKRRFSDHNLRTTYPGTLRVYTSPIGYVFAVLLYPFGKPLPIARARSFIAEVKVSPDTDGGVIWQRNFLRKNKTPLRVESVKQLGTDGGLMECIRPGPLGSIGMGLRVYEQNGALNFASTYYFLKRGKLRIPIPLWLTPGHTLVEHIDEGGEHFRFRLTMTHPLFGRTVYQDGVFSDPDTL